MGFGFSAIARRARAFLVQDTRAGATAIAAATVTVMTVGAAALITDHVWLYDQRDVLKTAADAASIAATLDIDRQLAANPRISDTDLEAALLPVARRYVLVNLAHLAPKRFRKAKKSLEVELDLDRTRRTVGVTARADLGGTLFSRNLPLLGNYAGPEKVAASTGIESESTPVEVVLAIDLSGSMSLNLEGNAHDNGRINAVKSASKTLVAVLDPNAHDRVAVGIVPWHETVRLDGTTAEEWARNRWARYPARRTYPVPHGCNGCTPDPMVHTLPASPPSTWLGCLDGHRIYGETSEVPAPTATALFETPSATPFAQSYFQPKHGYSYRCLDASELPAGGSRGMCGLRHGFGARPGQHECVAQPTLMPLSTKRVAIEKAIDKINTPGTGTYSTLGVLWAQRMLEPAWNSVWGGSGIHPADPEKTEYADIRKAIVLLTDGEDGYCGYKNLDCSDSPMAVSRTEACTAAKARGTEIFIVAAMSPNHVSSDFAKSLRACSSETDKMYPKGTRRADATYVFINNTTGEDIKAAFAQIGSQLRTLRKTS